MLWINIATTFFFQKNIKIQLELLQKKDLTFFYWSTWEMLITYMLQ